MTDVTPRQERLRKQRYVRRFKKRLIVFAGLAAAVYVLFWAITTFQEIIDWNVPEVSLAYEGTAEEACQVEAVVIRDEKAVTVPYNGTLNYRVGEGDRVAEGALLMVVEAEGVSRGTESPEYAFYSPMAGTVSLTVDGLEGSLTPDSLETLELKAVYKKGTAGSSTKLREKAAVKIVDNLSPVFLCFPCSELNLKKGDHVFMEFEGGSRVFGGEVSKDAGGFNLIKVSPTPDPLVVPREVTAKIISRRERGIVVPSSSLVKKEDAFGVYEISGSKTRWVEIKVKGLFSDKAVVEGISSGTEIVANPNSD